MNTYYFKTKGLTVGYDQKPLLKNIEIALRQGEILTLIEPNGAGKSTILKSIARQLETIEGCIYIGDVETSALTANAFAKKVSSVFTKRVYSEHMTCEEIIALGRYPYTGYLGRLSEHDVAILQETVKVTGVEEFLPKEFGKLSDGQKQRVLLARAICQEPSILILDEPTSFLDIRYKLELLNLLQKLQKEKNLTVIMSLHELDIARCISQKVMCVKDDHVVKIGTPNEVFQEDSIRELFSIKDESYAIKLGDILV